MTAEVLLLVLPYLGSFSDTILSRAITAR